METARLGLALCHFHQILLEQSQALPRFKEETNPISKCGSGRIMAQKSLCGGRYYVTVFESCITSPARLTFMKSESTFYTLSGHSRYQKNIFEEISELFQGKCFNKCKIRPGNKYK